VATSAGTGEPWRLDAAALTAAFRAGTLSPVQALEACLARIAAQNPALNAFVALRADAARADAQASARRYADGAPLSALDGVPIAVKDNLPTVDLPTTWGSVAGRDHRPARDELAVARARAAGLVIVGKTNVPEFTLEGYTHNTLFGTTRNPWNPALTPGGSSGGSVAAVAAGMVPLALGTDGGGSTRRPAGYTGLVGLKPSIGAIAREHALPPLLLDFEVVGPIARTAADLALLFGVLAGPHAADPASYAAAGAARALPAHLRVLYVPSLDGAPVDPGIAAACEAGAMRLQALGHAVSTGPLPLDLAALNAGWPRIGQIGLSWLFDHHPHWRQGAADKYLTMAEAGATLPGSVLWQTLEAAAQLRRDAAHLFERIDLIAMPSSAAMPWAADQPFPPTIAGQPVGPRGHAIFTGWVNAAGLPALSVPVAPVDGLPVGLQLIGPYGSDAALLALARALPAGDATPVPPA
jgi:aspartyl-tRNA(Asn)/glutamyl-tRNA(Gln) amidotransferase subunit A